MNRHQRSKCSKCGSNGTGGGSVMLWGDFTLNTQPATEYLDPGYSNTQSNLAPNIPQFRSPVTGTFQNLFVQQVPNTASGGNTIDITYRLRKNNSPTDLFVVLSSAASDTNITVNVPVEEGDLLDFEAMHGDFGVSAPTFIIASLKLST